MALYLVQHGKAHSKDEDPERSLTPHGIGESQRIAQVAAGYRVPVQRIQHSGKKRARQTAEIFASHLEPPGGVAARDDIGATADVAPVAEVLDPAEGLMLVGHLPFMARLTALLVAGDPELEIFSFQNSGIVCLDREEGSWTIRWSISPHID